MLKKAPDKRFLALSEVLAQYSVGEFDAKAPLSDNLDEIDTIISGVNMLGEELKETTISRDFFSSIYNAVAEMLFLISPNGIIEDVNETAKESFNHLDFDSQEIPVFQLFNNGNKALFTTIKNKLKTNKGYVFESVLNIQKSLVPVSLQCSVRKNRKDIVEGYLIIAEDISQRKETENKIMRAVVDTQEEVQKRVAKDLHDALGMNLSMVELLLTSLQELHQDKESQEGIANCKEWLNSSIKTIRTICFDLLPSILQTDGIVKALHNFVGRLNQQEKIKFHFQNKGKLSSISKEKEIALYRVAQEFVNNSLKHSGANNVHLIFNAKKNNVQLTLMDDGKGFDMDSISPEKEGRGLFTMETRIAAFKGSFEYKSGKGEGTLLKVSFPVENEND